MTTNNKYDYVETYLDTIRAKGRYSFALEELLNEFKISYKTLLERLSNLKRKNKIAQIRQNFYVIIPPEYSALGTLPPDLFIDAMMKYLSKKYYVGLLSAAALHGAAHQQPTTFFVMSEFPAPRNIVNDKLKIRFFSKQNIIEDGIIQKKTPSGRINVSSPELTAFDLLDNIKQFGINRIATILMELYEVMLPSKLVKIEKLVDNKANSQRLGFILDNIVGEKKLSNALYKNISKTNFTKTALSPLKEKTGELNEKWKIIINEQIETDL
ncbi:MAG: type IV toxin-antitoxin system AbiEi family antitoxin [Tannerella sp.]|jgi:predicted transcriptional regulator of viral defense system|nr:type IV toxin-antitoxin system AbiEi family antitoxin [Tannerella sp.]